MTTESDARLAAAVQAIADSHLNPAEILDLLRRTQPGSAPLAPNGRPMPTIGDYAPIVIDSIATEGTLQTFKPHIAALVAAHRDDYLDRPNADDCRALAKAAGRRALQRRPNARHGGLGAQENSLNALRYFFNRAVDAGYRPDNPAARVKAPRRRTNARRALEADEVRELYGVACSGGDDPHLDSRICRFVLETGARREGLINLRLHDMDPVSQLVRLTEKYGKQRSVPITCGLAGDLIAFASSRGANAPTDAVFRYRPRVGHITGAPLSRRRLNTLFERIQAALPWAARDGVSLHWLRHTAGTAIERIGGQAVAAAYLGHEHPGTVTLNYTKSVAREVCDAFSILTAEQHPLATQGILAEQPHTSSR